MTKETANNEHEFITAPLHLYSGVGTGKSPMFDGPETHGAESALHHIVGNIPSIATWQL